MSKGWVHLLLLGGAGIFLFPFLWMLSTSLKTDEELSKGHLLPTIPMFRARSPYVHETAPVVKPPEVLDKHWPELFSHLTDLAAKQITAVQRAGGASWPAHIVDADTHRSAAAILLVSRLVSGLDRALWTRPYSELFAKYKSLLTRDAAAKALNDSLARFELLGLQLRTVEGTVYNLVDGKQIAETWRIEADSGASLISIGDITWVRYHFVSADASPIVLRYDFSLLDKIEPKALHKLILSLRADNSWHRVDAELYLGADRWVSQRTTYIAQHRPMSIIFQMPSFEDTTYGAKFWVPLKHEGQRSKNHLSGNRNEISSAALSPAHGVSATLRLIISPSSTAQAIYGKVQRNYVRVFYSVPFWTYIGNSLLLVVLVTIGTLFSASFVAYAFARLHWPGRGVAFLLLLGTMMLPVQVTMIPSFMIWRTLGWYNTLNPLWVPAWFGNAFFIFLMTQHMKTIPKELEEAARLDGLHAVQTWWYIIIPQVKPALAAIAIMTFLGAWNEFMGPLIYLRDQSKFPLSLGLFGIRLEHHHDWTMIMAGNMLMILPVILVFFLFQRYFIQGMTLSGMKG